MMERITLKAVTAPAPEATADEGVFEAVISSASIDREKDIVSAEGMVRAMQRWVGTGKNMSLTWHHSTDPDKQIGYIDPTTARVRDGEVVASGWIDQSVPAGKDAWRLVKLGTLGFSFGYLTTDATPRKGGGRHLNEFDVFECTATPIPMNNDTRVLGWKGMDADELREATDELEAEARAEYVSAAEVGLSDEDEEDEPLPEELVVPDVEEQRRRAQALESESALSARTATERSFPTVEDVPPVPTVRTDETPPPPAARRQRERAEAYALEYAADTRAEELDLVTAAEPEYNEADDEELELEAEPAMEIPEDDDQRDRAAAVVREFPELRPEEDEVFYDEEDDEELVYDDPVEVPEAKAQRERADELARSVRAEDRAERERTTAKLKAGSTLSAEPFSSSRTSNWVARAGGLPHYVQHIAHDLVDSRGMSEGQAIQMAIGIVKRWASGGGKVTASTRAKAAAAVAEWERMKASARATPGKAVMTDEPDTPGVPDTDDDGPWQDYVDGLSDTDKAALFEVLYAALIGQQMDMSGGKSIDVASQRERADALIRQEEGTALLRITDDEMDGLASGELKAVWSAAYVDALPDDRFLYVESGGRKDLDGRTTPRSLRHFVYRDAHGQVDTARLRHAVARRIPAAEIPDRVKQGVTKRARDILERENKALIAREEKLIEAEEILASQKAEVTDRGHEARSVDPLRERAKAVELEFASGDTSSAEPPQKEQVAVPGPEFSLETLQQRARDEMLIALSGVDDI